MVEKHCLNVVVCFSDLPKVGKIVTDGKRQVEQIPGVILEVKDICEELCLVLGDDVVLYRLDLWARSMCHGYIKNVEDQVVLGVFLHLNSGSIKVVWQTNSKDLGLHDDVFDEVVHVRDGRFKVGCVPQSSCFTQYCRQDVGIRIIVYMHRKSNDISKGAGVGNCGYSDLRNGIDFSSSKQTIRQTQVIH